MEEVKKNVVIIIPTLTSGGAERVASILCNEWCKYPGVRVHLILLFRQKEFYLVDDLVDIHYLNFRTNQVGLKRFFSFGENLHNLRKKIRDIQPDFVLSFMNKFNVFVLISTLFTDLKVIVSERDSPWEPLPKIRIVLRKILYPRASGLICQTEDAVVFFKEIFKSLPIVSIPNPLGLNGHDYKSKGDRDSKIILNVARLTEKKGHSHLISAFSNLNAPGWKLVLVGAGKLRGDLEKQISDMNMKTDIILAGETNNPSYYYSSAEIFAFPSLFEGFPNALAEAMSFGLPCVSYNCKTGPSDLISDRSNGILVETGDIEELQYQLQSLVDSRSLREKLGNSAKISIMNLNVEKISKMYFDFCVYAGRTHS